MTEPIRRHVEPCNSCLHEHVCREIEGMMLCEGCERGEPCSFNPSATSASPLNTMCL